MNHDIPSPLFDTLDHLEKQGRNHLTPPQAQDYHHGAMFLYSYRGSTMTFNAYRREVERLLHWSWQIQQKSINQLSRADFESYLEFCQSPPKAWIGLKHVERFTTKEGLRVPNKGEGIS